MRSADCIPLLLLALALAAAPAGAHPGPHEQIAALTLALDRRPGDATLWIERARVYLADGDPAAALRDLERAQSLAPARADLVRMRGAALLAQGRAAEAEATLTLAIGREPASAEGHRLRGRARLALGRAPEAAADFERAVDLSPGPSPDDYLEWSRALATTGPSGRTAAIAALDRGLTAIGTSASLVEEAVALECAGGDFDAALARIERHPAAWGSRPARLARRGDVLLVAGRAIEAEAEYSAALGALESEPRRRPATAASLEARLRAALR